MNRGVDGREDLDPDDSIDMPSVVLRFWVLVVLGVVFWFWGRATSSG
ncbi:conserved hypothetical protein [delta proteobacterium NaphS2]|nr:conserved hypothetical protein [delta proteobacterium NaphS2]